MLLIILYIKKSTNYFYFNLFNIKNKMSERIFLYNPDGSLVEAEAVKNPPKTTLDVAIEAL